MGRRGRGATANRGAKATKRTAKDKHDEEPPQKLQKEGSFNTQLKKAIDEAKSSGDAQTKSHKPDAILVSQMGNKVVVHEDYACMLNQANINQNNNKFYVIQVVKRGKDFIAYTRWGRVGEDGANNLEYFKKVEDAIKVFKKKFKDKTKNDWDKKDNFSPHPGKYTLLEMDNEDDEDDDEIDAKLELKVTKPKTTTDVKCSLDQRTQLLIKIIFNQDMFKEQMSQMSLDVRRMPLGKLSKPQIAKGLEALIEIEEALNSGKGNDVLVELTSKFYTLIPHNFGRMTPPVLDNSAIIQKKKEVMMVLSDIELTQSLQKEKVADKLIHPLDEKYQHLMCQLELLGKNTQEYKILSAYVEACDDKKAYYLKPKLLDVWAVNRQGADARFKQHKDISFRKLLWHGTSIAVVAAILKAGLRIMPHSGGCVGKGIYFASEHRKSACYVGCHRGKFEKEENVGFMFLSEVALGKMKMIKNSNGRQTAAPKGYDSIVARGHTEPDPKKDRKLTFDGKDVIVPVGNPIKQKEYEDSSFGLSEYLIYKESQARIRYLLKFSF